MAKVSETLEVKVDEASLKDMRRTARMIAASRSGWASTKHQLTLIFMVVITGAWGSLSEESRAKTFIEYSVAMCALAGVQILSRATESVSRVIKGTDEEG